MSAPIPSPSFLGNQAHTRRIISYTLGIILPLAAGIITTHIISLHPFPMALNFLAVALVATLGGFGPSLIAVALSAVARALQLRGEHLTFFAIESEAVRISVLLAAAIIISTLGRRRRISEERLEIALAELQDRSDALVESLNSNKCASWVFDLEQDQQPQWYSGSYPIFGIPFSEIAKMPSIVPLFHPEDRPRREALIQQMRSTHDPLQFEYRTTWPNGETHWLEMRATRLPGPGCRWRGVTFDISERKHAEAALLSSEKLAAMGRLASTVAHEINNPLEAVTNLLYLSNSDHSLKPETRSWINMAERELARLGNITRLTLGFVRSGGEAATVDIAETIDGVISILQHRFDSRNIHLERHFEPGIAVVIAPHELRQIATNLISNAADAVSGADCRVAIRITRCNDRAQLIVEDNGAGIPEANLQRIFEPFFSTKDEFGTGIGLWVTHEIVEKNGGTITVESGNLPEGFRTRFQVDFPLATT